MALCNKRLHLGQGRCVIGISGNLFDKQLFITDHEWSTTYFTEAQSRLNDCLIAKVTKNYLYIKLLKDYKQRTRTVCLCCFVL